MASQLVSYITGTERQAQKYADFLWVVAEDAVTIHWSEIGALAQELLVRKKMTGREVREFLSAGTTAERMRSVGLTREV
jgi:hypothetical protein